MAREHLSKRGNWQAKAGLGGQGREETVKKTLSGYLTHNSTYSVIERPKHLKKIYGGRWGIEPDFAIENRRTHKIAFFETKRQGKGGNAHERACKYFAPGVERACGKIAGFKRPFFFIFMNGLTTDKKKRTEIEMWFHAPGYRDRFLLWGDRSPQALIEYFEKVVTKYLA